MAKRKRRWAVQTTSSGEFPPGLAALAAQQRGEDSFEWPAEPGLEQARVLGATDAPYSVDVDFARDSEGELVPIGVHVRRTFSTSRHKKGGQYPFVEGTEPKPVSAVDLRAIPFGRVIRAALTAAKQPEPTDERHDELERTLVPRGRPRKGRSREWYLSLLAGARKFEKDGLSPANEIARRKGVSTNLVYQWLHVARRIEEEQ